MPVGLTLTRMSLPYTAQFRSRVCELISRSRLTEMALCRRLPPDIAYIRPAMYSLLISAFRSISRYSAAVKRSVLGTDIGLIVPPASQHDGDSHQDRTPPKRLNCGDGPPRARTHHP